MWKGVAAELETSNIEVGAVNCEVNVCDPPPVFTDFYFVSWVLGYLTTNGEFKFTIFFISFFFNFFISSRTYVVHGLIFHRIQQL